MSFDRLKACVGDITVKEGQLLVKGKSGIQYLMSKDTGAAKTSGKIPKQTEGSKQLWEMTPEEMIVLAERGKLHKSNGKPTPGIETEADTPLSIGEREGYSQADIARFYLERSGVFQNNLSGNQLMDAVELAHKEMVADAKAEGKIERIKQAKAIPEKVINIAKTNNTNPSDIKIIQKEDFQKYFRMHGLPMAVQEGKGFTSKTEGRLFIDDDTGKPVAYIFSEDFNLSRLQGEGEQPLPSVYTAEEINKHDEKDVSLSTSMAISGDSEKKEFDSLMKKASS